MDKSISVKRHVFSSIISLAIASVVVFVVLLIDFSSTSGPIADPYGGIAYCLCPFFFVKEVFPIVFIVAVISESVILFLERKLKWWFSAILVFVIVFLVSYAIIFLNQYHAFMFILMMYKPLHTSIGISIFGVLYWAILLYSGSMYQDEEMENINVEQGF